tara:strand:+ start:181 stop:366 length:186 start_codon:yes stop_codon:yes gene_type:complete
MANAWLTHVKATMKKYPGKAFKEVLKHAKKTYKKTKSAVVGKKKSKKTRKHRKKSSKRRKH